jgi:hypothetical protein
MTTDENHVFERIRKTWPNAYVHFVLIYRCTKKSEGLDMKWCKAASSSSLNNKHYDEIAARYQEIAFQSYTQNRNFIIRDNLPEKDSDGSQAKKLYGLIIPEKPKPLPANSLGQRWWKFVIGSGATRNAGLVVIARVAAVDSKEIKNHIDRIQSVIGEMKK